jgi:glucose-1-phosphate cytidylyltransferase
VKVVILAGGLGTRLSEQTEIRPKPMIDVGGRPMLWHIMRLYAACGFNEFVVALGYKSEVIKDYFVNYRYRAQDLTVDLASGRVEIRDEGGEDWKVHLLDTGQETQTGGRVKRAAQFIGDETFLMTYGDGIADIDIRSVVQFHRAQGRLATVTAVRPPARFGEIVFDGDLVARFSEKPQIGEGWINGGFLVLEPEVVRYIQEDATLWEREPMESLAKEHQLAAYRHEGFWQCMDTLRDVQLLNQLWASGKAPWKR